MKDLSLALTKAGTTGCDSGPNHGLTIMVQVAGAKSGTQLRRPQKRLPPKKSNQTRITL